MKMYCERGIFKSWEFVEISFEKTQNDDPKYDSNKYPDVPVRFFHMSMLEPNAKLF